MAFWASHLEVSCISTELLRFGATFSVSWWFRVGGYLLWLFQTSFWEAAKAMPISAAMLCILCQLTQIPISWAKCELFGAIQWISWKIHLSAGFIKIPATKIDKLRGYLQAMLKSSKTSKCNLEKLIGLAMWITQVWPYMRIWIPYCIMIYTPFEPPTTASQWILADFSWPLAMINWNLFPNLWARPAQLVVICFRSDITRSIGNQIYMLCIFHLNEFGYASEIPTQCTEIFQNIPFEFWRILIPGCHASHPHALWCPNLICLVLQQLMHAQVDPHVVSVDWSNY